MTDQRIPLDVASDIELGMDAHAFMKSNIGRYLSARAESERADALEELAQADPDDAKAMRALQNRVKVVDSVMYWLAEAIQAGKNAETAYLASSDDVTGN